MKISIFLSVLLFYSSNLFALTGMGTEAKPYLIQSLPDFDEFAGNSDYWDDCIRLECNIDLSGRTYTTAVIAPDTDSSNFKVFDGTAFAGIFDGNGHKIINLTIDTFGTSNDYLGLFGKIGSLAEVKALGVENCNIAGGYFSGYLGVLVGENNEGDITNCYATGSVAGGNDSRYVGGLVGMNNRGNINNCYATSNATGGNSPSGFAGNNDRGDIKNCYATGSVTGFSDLGGFVGDNDQGHIINCFWDMQTSGKMQSDGGFGRSTTQMKDSITYIGWGDGLWTIDEGNDYPRLVWENAGGTIIDNIPERSYSGTGLEADPFIIKVAEDMYCMTIRQQDWNGYFELKNDVDMTGITYLPPYNFTGTFNGNGYEISNLTINEPGSPLLGLFGSLGSGSDIYNLGIINVVVTGSYYIGGLVGKNNNGNISNCYVSGSVSGDSYYVGGLVGRNEYGSIIDCYTMGTVTSESGSSNFGGLVGENYKGVISNCWTTVIVAGGRWSMLFGGLVGHNDGGNISKCYVMGNVNTGGSSYAVGGLVGMNDEGIISNSYAMGSVSGSGSYFAGLVGKSEYGSISNCYATGRVTGGSYGFGVGGLVGRNYNGSVNNSFWDIETSGMSTSSGGTGLPTAQMQMQVTFTDAGWDFVGETVNGIEDIWFIHERKEYPHLWWENNHPVADAGQKQTAYAGIDGIAEVELDGFGSYDEDGDELSYLWTWEIGGQVYDANGVNPVIELGVGEHEITLVVNDGLEDSEPNEVVVTVVGPVEVDVRVMPRVLNRKSQGRYVLAVMQLPDGIGRDDIDASYGFVLEPGGIDATFWRVRGRGGESIVFAMFDRARLIDATEGTSTGSRRARRVEVSVAGKLVFGEYIYGADVIRIIKPGKRPSPGVRHIRQGRR